MTEDTRTVRLCRVEDAAGRGPFASGLIHTYANAAAYAYRLGIEPLWPDSYYAARNAIAEADGLNASVGPDTLFGCLSLADLRYWFPSACGLGAMAARGALIGGYEVPTAAVRHGTRQVCFRRSAGLFLHHLPLATLARVMAPDRSPQPLHLPADIAPQEYPEGERS